MANLTSIKTDAQATTATVKCISDDPYGTLYSYAKTEEFTGTDEEIKAEIILSGAAQVASIAPSVALSGLSSGTQYNVGLCQDDEITARVFPQDLAEFSYSRSGDATAIDAQGNYHNIEDADSPAIDRAQTVVNVARQLTTHTTTDLLQRRGLYMCSIKGTAGAQVSFGRAFTGTLVADGTNRISWANGTPKEAADDTLSMTVSGGTLTELTVVQVTGLTNQSPPQPVPVAESLTVGYEHNNSVGADGIVIEANGPPTPLGGLVLSSAAVNCVYSDLSFRWARSAYMSRDDWIPLCDENLTLYGSTNASSQIRRNALTALSHEASQNYCLSATFKPKEIRDGSLQVVDSVGTVCRVSYNFDTLVASSILGDGYGIIVNPDDTFTIWCSGTSDAASTSTNAYIYFGPVGGAAYELGDQIWAGKCQLEKSLFPTRVIHNRTGSSAVSRAATSLSLPLDSFINNFACVSIIQSHCGSELATAGVRALWSIGDTTNGVALTVNADVFTLTKYVAGVAHTATVTQPFNCHDQLDIEAAISSTAGIKLIVDGNLGTNNNTADIPAQDTINFGPDNFSLYGFNPVSVQRYESGRGYYLSESGSDSNGGTSDADAYLTIDKVNQQTFAPGDTLYIRAGDRFEGMLLLDDAGTSALPISTKPYGNGARPTIDRGAAYTDWTLYYDDGGTKIWSGDNGLDRPRGVTQDDVYRTSIYDSSAPEGHLLEDKMFSSNGGNTFYYRHDAGEPSNVKVGAYNAAIIVSADYNNIEGIRVIGGSMAASTIVVRRPLLQIGECSHINVVDCEATQTEALGIKCYDTSSDVHFLRCVGHDMMETPIYHNSSGSVRLCEVYNSGLYLYDTGDRGGIGIQGGNLLVEGNNCHTLGRADNAVDYSISVYQPTGPVHVMRNYCHDNLGAGGIQIASDTVQESHHIIAYNVINNFGNSTPIESTTSGKLAGIRVQREKNVSILNNVVANGGTSGRAQGIFCRYDVENMIIKNNIIYNCDQPDLVFYAGTVISNVEIDNNMYSKADYTLNWQYAGVNYGTLTAWRDATGHDIAGTDDAPDWTTATPITDYDFQLRPGSPAIDVGAAVDSVRDYSSRPATVGAAPDMGAFEVQS